MSRTWVMLVAVAVAAMMIGCEQPEERAQVGIVAQPSDELRIGDRAPDFDFYDASAKRVRLASVRGDVTILAVLAAAEPNTCSIAGNVLMLAEKYSSVRTNVRYVCVSEPDGDICDLKSNIVERCNLASMRIIGLCDAGGRVKSVLRTKANNVYFVIGGDGRIVAKGEISDLRGMEGGLRKAVSQYEANLPRPYDE